MDKATIFNKAKEIVAPFSKASDAVTNAATSSSRFLEDLQVNSARLIDIILTFEDAFNIEISDKQADGILTIEDAVNLISNQRETAAA